MAAASTRNEAAPFASLGLEWMSSLDGTSKSILCIGSFNLANCTNLAVLLPHSSCAQVALKVLLST